MELPGAGGSLLLNAGCWGSCADEAPAGRLRGISPTFDLCEGRAVRLGSPTPTQNPSKNSRQDHVCIVSGMGAM